MLASLATAFHSVAASVGAAATTAPVLLPSTLASAAPAAATTITGSAAAGCRFIHRCADPALVSPDAVVARSVPSLHCITLTLSPKPFSFPLFLLNPQPIGSWARLMEEGDRNNVIHKHQTAALEACTITSWWLV